MGNSETLNDNRLTALRRIIAAIALCGFAVLLVCVLTDSASAFDDSIRYYFYDLRGEPLTTVNIAITNLSDKYTITGLCIILLILPWTRKSFGVPLSAAAIGITLVKTAIKHLVMRPRPEVLHLVEESGFSFPSGHAITSMCFYGLAIWLVCRNIENVMLRRILIVLLLIPIIFIGPTRVYLGVHYPTDIIAGWCLGFAAIVVIIEIYERLPKREKRS